MSAFFRNTLTGNLVYISCSDVRFFPHGWYEHILIRRVKHERDFTGEANHYTSLDLLRGAATKLTAEIEEAERG
jgi:hypothetical protein